MNKNLKSITSFPIIISLWMCGIFIFFAGIDITADYNIITGFSISICGAFIAIYPDIQKKVIKKRFYGDVK